MNIARMQQEDWQRFKAIRLRALRDTPDAFSSTLERENAMREEDWRARLASDRSATFIASLDRQDIGLIIGAPYKETDAAGLFSTWVAPEARRLGAGRSLVAAVVEWATSKQFSRLVLDVTDDNTPAVTLYERSGFLPTGNRGTFPPPRTHIKEHRRHLAL